MSNSNNFVIKDGVSKKFTDLDEECGDFRKRDKLTFLHCDHVEIQVSILKPLLKIATLILW